MKESKKSTAPPLRSYSSGADTTHGFGGQATGQGVQGDLLGAAVSEAVVAEVAHGVEQHAFVFSVGS